jgi:hypothetical protein
MVHDFALWQARENVDLPTIAFWVHETTGGTAIQCIEYFVRGLVTLRQRDNVRGVVRCQPPESSQ